MQVKKYYELTKPGIIYGNAITTLAGFFLAEKGHFSIIIFLGVLIGSSLVMASGCVFNNYLDRDIDARMKRTKNRPSVKGEIAGPAMLGFGTVLGILGFLTLILGTNLLTTLIGLVGFVAYVVLYTYSKRRTVYGTIIGSMSGAVPPVAGYCAVTNHFDAAAVILFLILVLWQIPHFYAIAMYRLDDYAAAAIPVLPLKRGMLVTKIHILAYITAFIVATAALTIFGYTGYIFLVLAATLGLSWLWYGIKGFRTTENILWGRHMFRFSLLVLTVLSLVIACNAILV